MNSHRAVSASRCVCAMVSAAVGLGTLADAPPPGGVTTSGTNGSIGGNLTAPTTDSPLVNLPAIFTLTVSKPDAATLVNFVVFGSLFLCVLALMAFALLQCCRDQYCGKQVVLWTIPHFSGGEDGDWDDGGEGTSDRFLLMPPQDTSRHKEERSDRGGTNRDGPAPQEECSDRGDTDRDSPAPQEERSDRGDTDRDGPDNQQHKKRSCKRNHLES